MDKEILTFSDIEIEKDKFYRYKGHINNVLIILIKYNIN